MKKLSYNRINNYLMPLKKTKQKYIDLEALSILTSISKEAIKDELEQFDPLISFDSTYDFLILVPILENELLRTTKNPIKKVNEAISKKEILKYEGINDFIYEHMSVNGVLHKNKVLSKKELLTLKKLVVSEIKRRNESEKS